MVKFTSRFFTILSFLDLFFGPWKHVNSSKSRWLFGVQVVAISTILDRWCLRNIYFLQLRVSSCFGPWSLTFERTVCAKAKANCIQESTEEVKAIKVPERDEDRSHPWYVFLLLKLSALLETSYSLSEGMRDVVTQSLVSFFYLLEWRLTVL